LFTTKGVQSFSFCFFNDVLLRELFFFVVTTHLFLLDENEREVIDEGDLEEGKKKLMKKNF
jgi:hypothetical protein